MSFLGRADRKIDWLNGVQRGGIAGVASAQLLCDKSITINGRTLVPDDYTAYVEFRLAYALSTDCKSVSTYNSAVHAGTVENSYKSLHNKVFNFMHMMRKYFKGTEHEDKVRQDHILGTVVEVEFPQRPAGGWRITTIDKTPSIRGVATLHKQAWEAEKIIGKHSATREFSVSKEMDFHLAKSGVVLVPTPKAKELSKDIQDELASRTPDDFREAGFWHFPFNETPDEIFECYDPDAGMPGTGMFTKTWRGYQPITLLNGLNGECQFKGVGLVDWPAEGTAHVSTLLAGDEGMKALHEGFQGLADVLTAFDWTKIVTTGEKS